MCFCCVQNSTRDPPSDRRRSSYDVGATATSMKVPMDHRSVTHHRHSAYEEKFRDMMNDRSNTDRAKDVLKVCHTWDFDVIKLENITNSRFDFDVVAI